MNPTTFGSDFLTEVPPTEYGCGCGDWRGDASHSGTEYLHGDDNYTPGRIQI